MITTGWFCFDNMQLNILNIPSIVPAVNLKSHNQTVSELLYPSERGCVISWTETLLFRFLTIKLVLVCPHILSKSTILTIKLLKSAPTILPMSITNWLAYTVAVSRRLVSRQFYFRIWPDTWFPSYYSYIAYCDTTPHFWSSHTFILVCCVSYVM